MADPKCRRGWRKPKRGRMKKIRPRICLCRPANGKTTGEEIAMGFAGCSVGCYLSWSWRQINLVLWCLCDLDLCCVSAPTWSIQIWYPNDRRSLKSKQLRMKRCLMFKPIVAIFLILLHKIGYTHEPLWLILGMLGSTVISVLHVGSSVVWVHGTQCYKKEEARHVHEWRKRDITWF